MVNKDMTIRLQDFLKTEIKETIVRFILIHFFNFLK